jgi:hypothetical protein
MQLCLELPSHLHHVDHFLIRSRIELLLQMIATSSSHSALGFLARPGGL